MLFAIHKSRSPFMAYIWLPNIKKISSTNPANIRCLLIIKVGHIGANNLFPNVMQIEKYLFSFLFVVYPETRIYRWDGLALRGRRSINCQGGIIKSNQRTSVFPSLISSFIWEKQLSILLMI